MGKKRRHGINARESGRIGGIIHVAGTCTHSRRRGWGCGAGWEGRGNEKAQVCGGCCLHARATPQTKCKVMHGRTKTAKMPCYVCKAKCLTPPCPCYHTPRKKEEGREKEGEGGRVGKGGAQAQRRRRCKTCPVPHPPTYLVPLSKVFCYCFIAHVPEGEKYTD